jgi:hypothetical protein
MSSALVFVAKKAVLYVEREEKLPSFSHLHIKSSFLVGSWCISKAPLKGSYGRLEGVVIMF